MQESSYIVDRENKYINIVFLLSFGGLNESKKIKGN